MREYLTPSLQRRFLAFLRTALKKKSSAALLGVPNSSLHYWSTGRRLPRHRARALLDKMRITWSSFLRNTKEHIKEPPPPSNELVVVTAAIQQLVSRSSQEPVTSTITLRNVKGEGESTVHWGAWTVRSYTTSLRVWAQLVYQNVALVEGFYSDVLWAEFWRVVKHVDLQGRRKKKSLLNISQLQKNLMKLH